MLEVSEDLIGQNVCAIVFGEVAWFIVLSPSRVVPGFLFTEAGGYSILRSSICQLEQAF